MKRLLIIVTILIIAGAGYFIYDYCEDKKRKEWESAVELERVRSVIKKGRDEMEWLEKALDFETDLRRLHHELGYSLKRSNDSVIAIQDRLYNNNSKEQRDWYLKEHRPYLETWVENFNK